MERGWNPNAPSHCHEKIHGKNTKNAGRKIPRFGSVKFSAICCLKSNCVNYRIKLLVEKRKMNLLFIKQFKPQGFKNNYG